VAMKTLARENGADIAVELNHLFCLHPKKGQKKKGAK